MFSKEIQIEAVSMYLKGVPPVAIRQKFGIKAHSTLEMGADVKIMDRLFWHREVPHSENFSKPGFQLKTA
ncbi:hypothetical protein [Weissella confusa]|uniref:hypothetical protein n=1 Tax=Weissella confusa TaxID=1583 RepID=UPI0013DE9D86|nr:hypothetical protein [Weissella confusa]QIE77808.1 hypothetical protein G4V46_00475 [Weissella confusa]